VHESFAPPASLAGPVSFDAPLLRLERLGAACLRDAELLALILRSGSRGCAALDVAEASLKRIGGCPELVRMGYHDLCALPGIGPAKAAALLAALELGQRVAGVRLLPGSAIRGPEDVYRHFHGRLRTADREAFFVLLLDGRQRIRREVQVSVGTLTASLVHPREVFREAIRESAAALVLVHNHPSGDPCPSREDREVTRRLVEAGRVVGIEVVDHVVVAERGFFSFEAAGDLHP